MRSFLCVEDNAIYGIGKITEFTKIRNTVGDDSVHQKIWSVVEVSEHPEQGQVFIIRVQKILLQLLVHLKIFLLE